MEKVGFSTSTTWWHSFWRNFCAQFFRQSYSASYSHDIDETGVMRISVRRMDTDIMKGEEDLPHQVAPFARDIWLHVKHI